MFANTATCCLRVVDAAGALMWFVRDIVFFWVDAANTMTYLQFTMIHCKSQGFVYLDCEHLVNDRKVNITIYDPYIESHVWNFD